MSAVLLLLLAIDLSLPLREPVPVFTVVLLVLLAAPLLARARVPSSVALLVAGIALGPHALNVLDRDATIVLLGTVGLLYIMFLAGLEIDLHEFKRHRTNSLAFGLLTFALPQTVGTAVGKGLGLGWPAAILLGSVFASHTLLAYPVVQRLGLQKERAVTTAVGATILTDTLALLLLAVIASGARAGGGVEPLVLLRLVGLLGALGGLVLWGLPRLGAWVLRTIAADPVSEFVFVLAAVFACALGAELIGVEPIIGAFLAGLALNRLVPEDGPLMNRIAFFGNALFIPFFLLSTGMLVNVDVFAGGGRAWVVTGAMVGVIVTTKGAAAWLTRPTLGYTAVEARVMFGLTVPQAAATLAAALVGFQVGLFDEAILNGTIAMVFVTCLVGPWVTERAGATLAAVAEARRPARTGAPARILVGVANPHTAERIVEVALLGREEGGSVQAVTVVAAGPDGGAVVQGERVLARAAAYAAGAAVSLPAHVRVGVNVPRTLARAASELRASALVMGWDGSAAATRLLFGSLPDRVLAETPAAVVVARGDAPASAIRRVLLAVPPLAELEPGFADALKLVLRLAARVGATIALVTPEPTRPAVARALSRLTPQVPIAPLALASWRELLSVMKAEARPGDAVVLVAARQGALSWRASLDRLPHALGRTFPEASLLVVYPAQVPASHLLPAGLTSAERAILDRLTPERIHIGLMPGSRDDLYRQVLASVPRERLGDALHALLPSASDVSPELRPGVVLDHARTDAVETPTLFVGVSAPGVSLPGGTAPVHAVLLFLAPAHVPPRRYVAWLGAVARLVRDDATVARLASASDADGVRAALLAAGHDAAPDAVPPSETRELDAGRGDGLPG